MDALTLHRLLGIVKGEGRQHHILVQKKLSQMGRDLGYDSIIEYRAGQHNFRQDIIDVVWLSGFKIEAAFEVRMKKHNLHKTQAHKDIRKLTRLEAKDKFIVNVSRISGKNYIHKILITSEEEIIKEYPK